MVIILTCKVFKYLQNYSCLTLFSEEFLINIWCKLSLILACCFQGFINSGLTDQRRSQALEQVQSKSSVGDFFFDYFPLFSGQTRGID